MFDSTQIIGKLEAESYGILIIWSLIESFAELASNIKLVVLPYWWQICCGLISIVDNSEICKAFSNTKVTISPLIV